MNGFVRQKHDTRAASPGQGHRQQDAQRPLSESERRRIAESAKVALPRTNIVGGRPDEANEQPLAYDPSMPLTARFRQNQRKDAWDTDSEQADPTTSTASHIPVPDSQVRLQDEIPVQQNYDDDEEEDYGGEDDEEGPGFDGYAGSEEPSPQEAVMMAYHQQMGQQREQSPNMFAQSQSYPTTTNPDEDERISSEPADDQDQFFEDRQRPPQQPTVEHPENSERALWPTSQQPLYASQQQQDAFCRVYQQDSALRNSNIRSDTNLAVRQGGARAESPRPQSSMSSQSAVRPQATNRRAERPQIVLATPKKQPGRQTTRHSPTASAADTINARNHAPGQPAETVPHAPSENGSLPPLDYDDAQLYEMPYGDLDAESFDLVPRADRSQTPFTDSNLPLDQRLGNAYGLDRDCQTSFFASLTLEEWEEAGDWFLEQFGGLFKKMRDARKERRRVAARFEEEIKERNEVVARKRKCVEDEIGKMRGKGQNLLPATPRRRGATPAP